MSGSLRALAVAAALMLVLNGCRLEAGRSRGSPEVAVSPTLTEEAAAPATPHAEEETGAAAATTPPPRAPTKGAPLERAAVQPPAAGRHIYSETATRKASGTQCPPSGNERPTSSSLVIDPPDGNRQRSVRERQRGPNEGMTVTTVLEYRKDGIYLVYLRQEQHIPIFPEPVVTEFEPSPSVLVAPAGPKVGQTWAFTLKSKDGKLSVDSHNVVEGTGEAVGAADGSGAPTTRIKRTSHIYGTALGAQRVDFSETATLWASPSARVVVKEIVDSDGTFGEDCRIETHLEAVMRSATPASN